MLHEFLWTSNNFFGPAPNKLTHAKFFGDAQEKMLENPFIDIYKEALKTALEDNVITADEQAMLETLQDQLNISKEQHDEIMNMIRE